MGSALMLEEESLVHMSFSIQHIALSIATIKMVHYSQ